jgi:cytochrome c peroxidase
MSLPLPGNAEFSIISLNDPYQCPETTGQPALYRRPLPSTNLKFLKGIMWDGREPDLQSQATNAALIHAQAAQSPTDSQLQTIVDLETSVFTAQSEDNLVGDLTSNANGGPIFLSIQPFSQGMNTGSGFNPNVFALYSGWSNASGSSAATQ